MGLAPRTLIVIAVCAALGVLTLLVILYRIAINSCLRPRASPLPPIQPLSHERAHQRAQFEASRASNPAFFTPSTPSPRLPVPRRQQDFLARELQEPSRKLYYCHPGWCRRVPHLLSPRCDPHARILLVRQFVLVPFPRRQSSRPGRDDRQTRRPASLSRGVPHARHSQVQIVLPAPLGTGILPNSNRQSMYELDVARDRMSIVDQWVPAGRDSIETSAPRRQRVASNPNTKSVIGGYQADERSMPPSSFTMAGYGETEGINAGGRGRRLTKRDGA